MEPRIEYITTAEQAERNAAARMQEMGFTDARVTGRGPDGGIDVRARDAVAQVKWQGAQTSRPELQNLYGARGINHSQQLLFFSASGYSRGAIEYADMVGIALFTFDPTGVLTARNVRAERLLAVSDSSRATLTFADTPGAPLAKPAAHGSGSFGSFVKALVGIAVVFWTIKLSFGFLSSYFSAFFSALSSPQHTTEFLMALATLTVVVVTIVSLLVHLKRR